MTWDEVVEAIGEAGPGHLATSSPDGVPHVARVEAVPDGDGLWMGTLRSSGKGANLLANPRVALMWEGGAEVYVWGTATVVDDPAVVAEVWGRNLFGYDPTAFFGAPDNADLLFLWVTPERATVVGAGPDGLRRRGWSSG